MPYMWQHISRPAVLIYLEASFETCTRRRHLNWLREDYEEQLRRLAHARQHADLVIETDALKISQVLEIAVDFLRGRL